MSKKPLNWSNNFTKSWGYYYPSNAKLERQRKDYPKKER